MLQTREVGFKYHFPDDSFDKKSQMRFMVFSVSIVMKLCTVCTFWSIVPLQLATTNKWNSPSKVPLKNSAIFSTTKRFEFKLMVLKTD